MKELYHYAVHAGTVITAGYYWFQHSILKKVIENKLERRTTMFNPIAGALLVEKDIAIAVKFAGTLNQALPQIAKLVADGQAIYADKANPTAEEKDLVTLLADLQADGAAFLDLFPKAPVSATTTVPVVPVV